MIFSDELFPPVIFFIKKKVLVIPPSFFVDRANASLTGGGVKNRQNASSTRGGGVTWASLTGGVNDKGVHVNVLQQCSGTVVSEAAPQGYACQCRKLLWSCKAEAVPHRATVEIIFQRKGNHPYLAQSMAAYTFSEPPMDDYLN